MSSDFEDWSEHQEAVANVFRELGCRAEVDKTVIGARGHHKIDVYVTFENFGQKCCWIIECKLWKKPVDKSVVHNLQTVVQNVGADRGVIFCENGFQSGACIAAQHTNILLQGSLEEFRHTTQLSASHTSLTVQDSKESDAPSVYSLPSGYQPHHLFVDGKRMYVSNGGKPQMGSIAIVNLENRSIESIIELDKYEQLHPMDGKRQVLQHPPGNIVSADGKLFVGQVFSKFILVIDVEVQAIIKRIPIPGGGEGTLAASPDGRHIYFASNSTSSLFIIDSATYDFSEVAYPRGGRGCLCVLPHPSKPLLYIGIQRGGNPTGVSPGGGGCFLAVYNLTQDRYIGSLYLAEESGGDSDNSIPISLTYDEADSCLYVGMFQSLRGICRVDELGTEVLDEFRFAPNSRNEHFPWVDPLSQAIYGDKLLSVNRNNRELVTLDKRSGQIEDSLFLGEAPNGPRSVAVFGETAIISYPERGGLIFHNLAHSVS